MIARRRIRVITRTLTLARGKTVGIVTRSSAVVCANQIASRHRDMKIHDRHYRCCHYLERREREQRRDQSSGWRLGKRSCASARWRTSRCRSRHVDPPAQVHTGRTPDAVGNQGYHRCGLR